MTWSRNIKILLTAAGFWYFGEGMLGPLFAVYAQKIGGDILEISWAWATFLIMTGVMYILLSRIVKGRERKAKVMLIGYALNALFTFAYLFVSSPWQLLIVQAGLGFADALATPAWDALFAESYDKEHATFAWGLAGGQAHIITGVAIIAGGMIVNYFSFDALFITMGSVQVIATIIQARILKLK